MNNRLPAIPCLSALLLLFFIHVAVNAQSLPTSGAPVSKKYPASAVKTTIDGVTAELAAKHPGFYRYQTEAGFRGFIDSVKTTITDSLTALQAFVKMKAIIAHIGCLHTDLTLQQEMAEALNRQPNLLPLQLYVEGDRVFVVQNLSAEQAILAGDEVMRINGEDIGSITAKLLTLIPSDGYNQTLKYRALYHQFPLWYRYINPATEFSMVLKRDDVERSFNLRGARFDEIAADGFLREPQFDRQLDFRVDNGVAFLTIRSFSESAIKQGGQRFRAFIDDAFSAIRSSGVRELVVDLRGNTGGSDGNAVYFVSHFFDQPFRYWDRIEVTKAVAADIKGVGTTLFYRKPIEKDGVWLWQKAKTVRDFDYYQPQDPARNPFTGNTLVMIDGFCMSSCSDAVAILQDNGKALFIGEETGGGYQGNNSGLMPSSIVEPFPFSVTVPLQKYVNHVDTAKNMGRGTIPDYPQKPAVMEVAAGKDPLMAYALRLIAEKRSQ